MLPLIASAASLAEFEASLNGQDSATAALRQWCEIRRMASPAIIHASRVAPSFVSPPRDLRRRLEVQRGEEIAFRHVRLSCAGTVLSEAYNWYVPGRLTPEMNARLAATDTPFGAVAAPLHFHRERLRASRTARGPCPGPTILTHRARLVLPDGRPLAMLVECYMPENLTAGS